MNVPGVGELAEQEMTDLNATLAWQWTSDNGRVKVVNGHLIVSGEDLGVIERVFYDAKDHTLNVAMIARDEQRKPVMAVFHVGPGYPCGDCTQSSRHATLKSFWDAAPCRKTVVN